MVANDDRRAERLGHNQARFREINDQVDSLIEDQAETVLREDFLCECCFEPWVELIAITPAQYDELRKNPVRFAVFPAESHVFADIERVVGRTDSYWIVEKHGASAKVAKAEEGA